MSESHSHGRADAGAARLGWTLALVVLYAAAEVVGGLLSGSLALLADAGHMVSDAAAIGLTLFAIRFARRPPTSTQTFGYYRGEILAALVNGATLVGIAIVIVVEASSACTGRRRWKGPLMLAIAGGGLLVASRQSSMTENQSPFDAESLLLINSAQWSGLLQPSSRWPSCRSLDRHRCYMSTRPRGTTTPITATGPPHTRTRRPRTTGIIQRPQNKITMALA